MVRSLGEDPVEMGPSVDLSWCQPRLFLSLATETVGEVTLEPPGQTD